MRSSSDKPSLVGALVLRLRPAAPVHHLQLGGPLVVELAAVRDQGAVGEAVVAVAHGHRAPVAAAVAEPENRGRRQGAEHLQLLRVHRVHVLPRKIQGHALEVARAPVVGDDARPPAVTVDDVGPVRCLHQLQVDAGVRCSLEGEVPHPSRDVHHGCRRGWCQKIVCSAIGVLASEDYGSTPVVALWALLRLPSCQRVGIRYEGKHHHE
mmetsp:Transcript_101305/g.295052  ORF Transcript_101305/g.295052 Transcript_101305/m.295052 type:complete len:209 (+) Transcript_101305:1297-1923(+)